ncbi:MAG: hypothetical protein ACI90U_000596 [Pseudomonadales bacterium]|jgi:hypothetical protein
MLRANIQYFYLAAVFMAFSHQLAYFMGYGVIAFNASYAAYNYLCFIAIAYYFVVENQQPKLFYSKRILGVLLLFLAVSFFASASSEQPVISLLSWSTHVSVFFLGLSAYLFITVWPNRVGLLIAMLMAGGFAIVFKEWFSIYENWSIYKHLKSGDIVQVVTFNHIRNMMHMVTAMWLISFYFYTHNLKAYRFLLLLLVQFILLGLLIWAAGRVHLLLLPLAILMLCVLFRSYNVALKITISSLLMVIISVVTLSFVGQDFMFKNLTERMKIDANNLATLANIESGQKADVGQESVLAKDIIGRLGSDRGSLWLKDYDLWEQKPVLGNGADGYYLAKNGSEGTHPHNWIVLLLVQYGLIGFICFTFLIKSILSVAVTSYLATKNGLAVLVIVYNTVFLLYGLLSGCFYYTLPLMFFVIVNGLFLGSYYNKKADRGGNEVL